MVYIKLHKGCDLRGRIKGNAKALHHVFVHIIIHKPCIMAHNCSRVGTF